MRTRTRTGVLIGLFLVVSLLCSVSLVAQDKLLITSTNKTTVDQASLDCWAYASDGTTCIAGQYYHSDNTKPSSTWVGTATTSAFGAWTTGNGSVSGCLSCHHGTVSAKETSGMSRGGAYLVGGHKNILRKVTPGTPILNSEGVPVEKVVDHNGGVYTMDANGILTGAGLPGNGKQAWFLAGWLPEPDVFGDFGQTTSGIPYGSCARCHTTGYRVDDKGPEPTLYDATTKLTTAQFPRIPAGSKTATGDATGTQGPASSWYLSGIQCERCHRVDMQVDPSLLGSGSPSGNVAVNGRIGHHGVGGPLDVVNGKSGRNFATVPNDGIDHTVTPYRIPGTDLTLTGQAGQIVEPGITAPYGLECVECHQAYSTWTAKTVGQVGQTHVTPLPGFESLATPLDSNYTSTKLATGQFTATWACTGAKVTVAANDYDGCVNNGGTVSYTPGGMSHGIVTTILNSPHARVTGYVDFVQPGSNNTMLTIKGGALANGVNVKGQFNTHFASEAGVSGSCMGCHDIHGYMEGYAEGTTAVNVKETLKSCTECHADHGKAMAHPTGAGTPFPDGKFGSQESCNICHFAKKAGSEYHFLRINPDPNYKTFPDAKTYYTTYKSGQFAPLNTYDAGETYVDADGKTQKYPAVALDVDMVCGQCHTGGDGSKSPYGLAVYPGDNNVKPLPYSRAFLAAKAVAMHSTTPNVPTLSIPLPAFGGPVTINISSNESSEGSKIGLFYTLDGTTPKVKVGPDYVSYIPATTSTLACATNPCDVAITSTKTLYAIAAGPKTYNFGISPVVGGTYGVQVAPTPVISPTGAALTYSATLAYPVKLTDAISTAQICYTVDNTAPVAGTNCVPNNTTITVNKSQVIKAIATAANYGTSNVATGTFTVTMPNPTFVTTGGAKFPGTYTGPVSTNFASVNPNAVICYTINGTTPSVTNGVCTGWNSTPGVPIALPTGTITVRAIAYDGTNYAPSKMITGTYIVR